MSIGELIDAWLTGRERSGLKPSSLRIYRMRLEPIRRRLGTRPAAGITRLEWIEALHQATQSQSGARLAAKTINLTLTLVGALQTFALDFELIAAPWLKPSDLKRLPTAGRGRIATPDETRQLLAEMSPVFRLYYQGLRLTGARRGELCAARIEHLEGQSPQRSIVLKEHKSSRTSGPRIIYLGAEADALVTRAIGRRRAGPIFVDDRCLPWQQGRVTRIFSRLRDRLGISADLKLHSTRHEFATAMVQRHGIKAAQIACGHKDIKTTEAYAHLGDEYLRQCVTGLYGETGSCLSSPSQPA